MSPTPEAARRAGEPEVSVVVPDFNERGNLEPLRDELVPVMESTGRRFEILFVDDGSVDGSAEVLRSLRRADPRIRVLTLELNSGQTAAMSAGFDNARGEMVVTLDADLQND